MTIRVTPGDCRTAHALHRELAARGILVALPDCEEVLRKVVDHASDVASARLAMPAAPPPQDQEISNLRIRNAELRGQVERTNQWLDQQIEKAAAEQERSFASATQHGNRQGERWHARQCALYEAKMKLLLSITSTEGQ